MASIFMSIMIRSGFGLFCFDQEQSCKEIGLDKKAFRLYHKNHIDKVMAVAVTGFAFENNIENGGTRLKLRFRRAQAAKRAQKMQRESRRDKNGKNLTEKSFGKRAILTLQTVL